MIVVVFALVASLDGNAAFAEGVKLYDKLEYEQATFRFQEVAIRTDVTGGDRALALAWLGLSYAGAGDFDAARRAFVDAVRADRNVALPVEVSPRLATLFDEAKASVPADATLAPEPAGPAAPKPADEGTPIAAGVGAAGGVVVLAAGVGLAILCGVAFDEANTARARGETQLKAKAALDTANLAFTGAGILIPTGAAVGGVAGFFLYESLAK